jgi:hypothetical protein
MTRLSSYPRLRPTGDTRVLASEIGVERLGPVLVQMFEYR